MKRFLSVGEGYVLSRTPKPTLLLLVIFMCLSAVKAKEPDPITHGERMVRTDGLVVLSFDSQGVDEEFSEFSKVHIGQRVPNSIVIGFPVYNSDVRSVSTDDFKRRAVIIDVWATWCGSCIARFPTLDSLQGVYATHVDFYLLNNLYRDSKETVESFLADYKERFPAFSLSLLVGNSDSRGLFPAESLPHYIWIDANGRVKAITGPEAITGHNIERLIAGLSINVKEKVK